MAEESKSTKYSRRGCVEKTTDRILERLRLEPFCNDAIGCVENG